MKFTLLAAIMAAVLLASSPVCTARPQRLDASLVLAPLFSPVVPQPDHVKRDIHGRIARDPHAKEAFRKTHPWPSTGKMYGACPGWVVDHVHALKHGGADDPSNMQWQTRAAAKAKDKWE